MEVKDIIYYGNGMTVAFDDNSVAHPVYKVIDGSLTLVGLSVDQQAAMDRFQAAMNPNVDQGAPNSSTIAITLGEGAASAVGRGNPSPTSTGSNSFVHGSGCTNEGFANTNVGLGNTIKDGFRMSAIFGANNNCDTPGFVNGIGNLVFGLGNTAFSDFGSVTGGAFNYNYGFNNVVIGYGLTVGGVGSDDSAADGATFGYASEVHSGFSLCVGNQNFLQKGPVGPGRGEMLVLGYGNVGMGSDMSIIVGHYCRSDGRSTIAQGLKAHALRAQQRCFSADRNALGAAQHSFLPAQTSTLDSTPKVGHTFPLEPDKAYVLKVVGVVYNTDTDDLVAGLASAEFTAYRKSTGGAIIVGGGPVTMASVSHTGGASAAYTAGIDVSSDDLEINIVGDASDELKWTFNWTFIEVLG